MRRVEETKFDGDAKEAQATATRDGSLSVERDQRHEASQATTSATRGAASATRRELRRWRREIDRRRWNEIGDTRGIFARSSQMSPFKKSAVKGSNGKGKVSVIDVDRFTPKSKKTRSSIGFCDANKFRSYATFQAYESYFKDAPLLVERDWSFLLTSFDETYEQMVKEFYANAISDWDEMKCWVRGKDFKVTPSYLAIILHINRPMFKKPLIYDDLDPQILINIRTLNASISHTRKGAKQESHAPHRSSSSSSHPYDEKLDNIMSSIQEISTKLSGLAFIMHTQHTHFDTKFTSLQTQLDQIQRKLEEDED
ncbi:hypothetical protein SO802_028737 [Lithocarpus litseifolius]|uniref:Uncharacterized protein n=1 Tax=Lithocarpus litseifolius TaxID=425828 RepID=A0AAW2BSM7_9ROSI